MSEPTVPMAYVGKIPSRGDFVRSAHSPELVQTLDRWLARSIERMGDDPRWKLVYDGAPAVHFAFLGPRVSRGLVGHLVPSRDAAGRRFPFAAAGAFEVRQPQDFLARSPLALARPWARLETLCQRCTQAQDMAQVQQLLSEDRLALSLSPAAYEASFADFQEMQTVGAIEALLVQAGHEVSLRRTLLALGLLRPLLAQPGAPIDKGLQLPLVGDAVYQPLLAAWWLQFVAGFVRGGDVELGLLLPRGARPRLLLGFQGASARSLLAALDPQAAAEDYVDVAQAEWVEDCLDERPAVRKLSDYLRDPHLSLRQAVATFHEAFLGE